MNRFSLGAIVALSFVAIMSPSSRASAAPSALRSEIAAARASDPAAFTSFAAALAKAPEVSAKARGRKAPLPLYLAGMGSRAFLPMVDAIVDPKTSPELRRDVVEAVGLLRDPRGLPVLATVLAESTDPKDVRAAAEAIGRLGTVPAGELLVTAADGASADKRLAILAAIGECRTTTVAQALARRVAGADAATARILARSLGRVGNAWAWRTAKVSGPAHKGDTLDPSAEAAVRETAARALVTLFVAHDGEARDAASNALMVVDAPGTASLVGEAKAKARAKADPALEAALDALSARLAKNPTR